MTGQNGSGMLSVSTIEVWKGADPVPQQKRAREPEHRQISTSKTTTAIPPTGGAASPPVLSVHLLGPFRLENAAGMSLDPQAALGRPHSILLFKLLLCHPERRVSRDQLTRIMWPGQTYASFGGSLDTAKSLLKNHLEAVSGRVLLPRVSGDPPSFLLAGQAMLWTDIDACEQFIRRAISTEEAAEALPLWEAAYVLFQRGELLAEDQDAYWYESRLVQERRKRLAKQRLQCAFRIADLSLELGESERAIAVLSEESEANPAHEDLALHLMELFAQRGQLAEALQWYARVEAALLERNSEPRADLRTLVQHLRSAEATRPFPEKYASIPARTVIAAPLPSLVASTGDAPLMNEPAKTFSARGHVDWGEAPRAEQFYGRVEELATLKTWILEERCRLVTIVGMGGIGKTSLAAVFAEQVHTSFDALFWRSLQHAPPLRRLLQECIAFLSHQQRTDLPDALDQLILILLEYLRERRCLIVFDNVETVLQSGSDAGVYRTGYEEYQTFFQRVSEAGHQSCLLLTSREKPKGLSRLEGNRSAARLLYLSGVGVAEGKALLHEKELAGSDDAWEKLIRLYAGNPLALQLISEPIRELFNGNILAFLTEGDIVVGDITDLLEQQFHRLSQEEKDVLYWLAIEREPVSLNVLWDDTVSFASKKTLITTLTSLRRRSMIEGNDSAAFTLQPVIMEYVTETLIKQICEEIQTETMHLLTSHALCKALAKEYVREAQVRLIILPILEHLLNKQSRADVEHKCKALLALLHQHSSRPGYATGNLLHLLIQMRADLRAYDFSSLPIRQAYLQGASLPGVNFAHADLMASIFTDTFGSILSVAFHPDGLLLAAGTTRNDIRLWRVSDGIPSLTLQGHTGWVRSVAFHPNERMLASGSDDQAVRLWDVNNGQCLEIFHGHSAWVRAVAFSPNGRVLASGSEDQSVRLWDVKSAECLMIMQEHTGRVRTVAFHPGGELLASAGEDHLVRLWEVRSGKCLQIFQGHTDRIRSIAFSPDGQLLASGGDDHVVNLWNLSTGMCIQKLQGHTEGIRSVVFHQRSTMLASGGEDQTIRIWDVQSGKCLHTLQGHTQWVWSLAFHPDGKLLASGGEDRSVRLWDVEDGQCLKTFQGYINWDWSVAFSPDGNLLASGGEDHLVRIWETKSGECLKILPGHTSRVRSVAFHPDGSQLASSSEDGTIRLWNRDTGKPISIFRDSGYRFWSILFSPDGRLLAGCGEDYAVYLWDARNGQRFRTFQGHSDRIRSVAISPDGKLLASSSEDQTIRVWDVRTGSCVQTLRGHSGRVWTVAFGLEGKFLASGGDDHTVRIWSIENGDCLAVLTEHTARVRAVMFCQDDSILASGSEDTTIRLWKADTGECLHILRGHTGRIRSLAVHPQHDLLASSSEDGMIKLWAFHTGICVKTLTSPKPYEGMNITAVTGLTETQRMTLKELGAIEI